MQSSTLVKLKNYWKWVNMKYIGMPQAENNHIGNKNKTYRPTKDASNDSIYLNDIL